MTEYLIKTFTNRTDVKPITLTEESLPELARRVAKWQRFHSIRVWEWRENQVFKNGKVIGYMSYNGKVWAKAWDMHSKEIT